MAVVESNSYARTARTDTQAYGERQFVVDRVTRSAEWFFRTPITDREACEVLRGAPDGCFIVRVAEFPQCFILSYWYAFECP